MIVAGNPVQIRRLYLIYTFIGLALCVLAGNLLAYEVPLRAGLSMDQFGLVLGMGQALPAIVNLLTAPLITRYKLEFWAVIVMPLLRIFLGTAFVILPMLTRNQNVLTLGFSIIFVLYMICPYLSNNALQSIIKRVIPESELGMHTSRFLLWQFIPGTLMGIFATFMIERFDDKSPTLFYKLMLIGIGLTSIFQVACSVVAYWMMRTDEAEAVAQQGTPGPAPDAAQVAENPDEVVLDKPTGIMAWFSTGVVGAILPPFLDARFRFFMRQFFFVAVVTGMSQSFVFPYFTRAMGWSLMEFQTVSAVMVCLGMLFLPAWGALADKIGGRNVFQAAQMVHGLVMLLMATGKPWGLWVYIAVSFYGLYGLVGTGIIIGQQYLMVSFSDKRLVAVYIAGFTLVCGAGGFLGSIVGGAMLEWLRQRMPSYFLGAVHYEVYFMICGMGHLFAGWLIGALPDVKPALSRAQVGYELFTSLLKTLRLHRP
jgi:F0F1-type ATP synthase assembly protein I